MGCKQSKAIDYATVQSPSNGGGGRRRRRGGRGNDGEKESLTGRRRGRRGDKLESFEDEDVGGGEGDEEEAEESAEEQEAKARMLFDMLKDAQNQPELKSVSFWAQVCKVLQNDPSLASYQDHSLDSQAGSSSTKLLVNNSTSGNLANANSATTPLHMACHLLDVPDDEQLNVVTAIRALINACPSSVGQMDVYGNLPLHYSIFTTTPASVSSLSKKSKKKSRKQQQNDKEQHHPTRYKVRAQVIRMLVAADFDVSQDYLTRNDVVFDKETGGVTPLYHAIQAMPDDFTILRTNGQNGGKTSTSPSNNIQEDDTAPTVEFLRATHESTYASSAMVGVGNADDGDKPLALLYRRFTRQFDISEKFFAGDNSRPEVVQHRQQYKTAAGHTWSMMELLLQPLEDYTDAVTKAKLRKPNPNWKIVHRAVQIETPPDLLRYIVETNAEDLTRIDEDGNLPLHYAAKSKPPSAARSASASSIWTEHASNRSATASPPSMIHHSGSAAAAHYPAFYSKYVMDELLYKFPEAATMVDGQGKFALTLAVGTGKQWIGGGVKSLYDAYPEALKQIDLKSHQSLRHALSLDRDDDEDDAGQKEKKQKDRKDPQYKSIIRDEQHDAIMLVQSKDVHIDEVISCMWAHEEDAGVQMLACVAVSRLAEEQSRSRKKQVGVLRIALSSVAAVVNAMKAHPNEPIVQDKACLALRQMALADGYREVSFVASGAIAAMVGAMQAHVSDATVQQEALAALADVVLHSGSDRATVVASVSGLTAMVNAMAAHPKVEGVQREACRALLAMTDFSKSASLPDLPRSQVEPLLLNAKRNFPAKCGASADVVLSRLS